VGVSPKATYVIRWKAANALAFPIVHRIAISDTALEHLADEELVAICVHELGHLTESKRVKRLRVAGAFVWLPVVCTKPIMGSWGTSGLVALGLLVLFGHHAIRRLTRAMEERADAISHAHEGEPGTYARALEHLYQINLMPAVMRQKRATHPHLYDRLAAAGINPAYPRPKPPPLWRAWIAILAMVVCALLYLFVAAVLLTLVVR